MLKNYIIQISIKRDRTMINDIYFVDCKDRRKDFYGIHNKEGGRKNEQKSKN